LQYWQNIILLFPGAAGSTYFSFLFYPLLKSCLLYLSKQSEYKIEDTAPESGAL
jgi:hypothetical protein